MPKSICGALIAPQPAYTECQTSRAPQTLSCFWRELRKGLCRDLVSARSTRPKTWCLTQPSKNDGIRHCAGGRVFILIHSRCPSAPQTLCAALLLGDTPLRPERRCFAFSIPQHADIRIARRPQEPFAAPLNPFNAGVFAREADPVHTARPLACFVLGALSRPAPSAGRSRVSKPSPEGRIEGRPSRRGPAKRHRSGIPYALCRWP